MSLDYTRRDCSKCRNPGELERISAPGTFFDCPSCKRRYERAGARVVAAEDVLQQLLAPAADVPLTFAPTRRRKLRGRAAASPPKEHAKVHITAVEHLVQSASGLAAHGGSQKMDQDDPRERGAKPPYEEAHQNSAPGTEAAMQQQPDHGESSYVGTGRLSGKAALITGGDSGIGRAVALAFAREGADVAICYFPSEETDARAAAELVKTAGRRALLVEADLAEATSCAAVIQRTVAEFGRIDILVNNAAHQEKAAKSIEELTPERVDRTFRVNIIAMFHLVREALPHMPVGSAIINTASIQAYNPSPPILDYAVTKGAIVAFTKGLALSAVEQGIRVNAVAPGPVWTPLIAESFEGEKLRMFGAKSPMKRPAQPAELAPAYVFLASAEASYINGEILGITGGSPLG